MQYFKAFYKNITLYSYKDEYDSEEYLPLGKMLETYSKDILTKYSENTRYSTFSSNKIKNYSTFISKLNDLDLKGLDLSTKILIDIISDSSIEQYHYKCLDFVSPTDFQELSQSYFSDYCLLYFLENPENYDQVDEGVNLELGDLIDSNLNSAFLTSLILSNTTKID